MDKKRKPPLWMPIYVADLIADTAHLTTVQFGAYVRLLCAMWRSEDGALSDNPETLEQVRDFPILSGFPSHANSASPLLIVRWGEDHGTSLQPGFA
jgi:hypothetical protein